MGKQNNRFGDPDDVPVGKSFKESIKLSLKKLMLDNITKDVEFAASLTDTERKYIHHLSHELGLKSKSRGKPPFRFITVSKKDEQDIKPLRLKKGAPLLVLTQISRLCVEDLLQKHPVTNEEREDLLPVTEKDGLINPKLRTLKLAPSVGRFKSGTPKVPPFERCSGITAEARRLPVWELKEQLLLAVHHNQVILVCGETGSGKTTQVPQMLLQEAAQLNKPCRIFCTQPRRISALSIAERVSAERGENLGFTVGYQIRMESKLSPKTLLNFCTTGVLLRTLMGGDAVLSSITHVIVDEVHERDRFTDFLLTVLRDALPKFKQLKLILMSANLDANLYVKYFNGCPILNVPGKTYAVKDYYLEDALKYTGYQIPNTGKAQKEKAVHETASFTGNIVNSMKGGDNEDIPRSNAADMAIGTCPNYQSYKMANKQKELLTKKKGTDEASDWRRNIIRNLVLAPVVSKSSDSAHSGTSAENYVLTSEAAPESQDPEIDNIPNEALCKEKATAEAMEWIRNIVRNLSVSESSECVPLETLAEVNGSEDVPTAETINAETRTSTNLQASEIANDQKELLVKEEAMNSKLAHSESETLDVRDEDVADNIATSTSANYQASEIASEQKELLEKEQTSCEAKERNVNIIRDLSISEIDNIPNEALCKEKATGETMELITNNFMNLSVSESSECAPLETLAEIKGSEDVPTAKTGNTETRNKVNLQASKIDNDQKELLIKEEATCEAMNFSLAPSESESSDVIDLDVAENIATSTSANYQASEIVIEQKGSLEKEQASCEAKERTRNIIIRDLNISETSDCVLLAKSREVRDLEDFHTGNCNQSAITQEMDACIEEAFTQGDDEYFNQLIYLIMSEDVSPNYQHSTTLASPLMVAAGRGRIDILEQLLTMGASIGLKAANDWTAIDWALATNQKEAANFLQSYREGDIHNEETFDFVSKQSLSREDQVMLEAYNLSITNKIIDTDLIFSLCLKIHLFQPPGGILIFLPGYEDIVTMSENIISEHRHFRQGGKYDLFCLHSSMQSNDQKRVFRRSIPGVRKIVLATNIAETSITINDIVYVIDSGKVKEMTFDAIGGVSCLRPVWISQASAMQRRGRAGRCQPGICYHLFSKSAVYLFQKHQTPEILRTPLQDLCLHTKLLALPNMMIADFLVRAPEPPSYMAVTKAVQLLKSMDALDILENVTELGHHLLDLPLPPNLGKMVIISTILKCLDPVLIIAVSLSYRDPFILPMNPAERHQAKKARKSFAAFSFSDHIVFLDAFQEWEEIPPGYFQKKWCEKHFISGTTMEMILGMKQQVLTQLRSSGFVRSIRDVNTNSENWPLVKAALLSGIYPNIVRVDRKAKQIKTEKDSKVWIHVSSVLQDSIGKDCKGHSRSQQHKSFISSLPSDWLMYNEMILIGIESYIKTVTLVSPLAVLLMTGPMRLPLDALLDPSNEGSESVDTIKAPDGESTQNCTLKITEWIQFIGPKHLCNLVLQLRQKLYALILRRLTDPCGPLTKADSDIVNELATIFNEEDLNLGLKHLPSLAQTPKTVANNAMGSGINLGGFGASSLSSAATFVATPAAPQVALSVPPIVTTPAAPQMTPPETLPPLVTTPAALQVAPPDTQAILPLVTSPETPPVAPSMTPLTSSLSAIDTYPKSAKSFSTHIGSSSLDHSSGMLTNVIRRYFLLVVDSTKVIDICERRNLWPFNSYTQWEVVEASKNAVVILFFAARKVIHGYAIFRGQKSKERCRDLLKGVSSNSTLFKIEWIKKCDIYCSPSFLKVSRGKKCQELESSVGDHLLKILKAPAAGIDGPTMNTVGLGPTVGAEGGSFTPFPVYQPPIYNCSPFNMWQFMEPSQSLQGPYPAQNPYGNVAPYNGMWSYGRGGFRK